MKFLFAVVVGFLISDLDKIGKINSTKDEARQAYENGDYQTAISKYKYLRDSLGVQEDEVILNLANAYFQANDTLNAQNAYQGVSQAAQSNLRSVAQQQLGVLANRQGRYEEALNYFKQALKASPNNEEARYNYEMVKKKLAEQKKQQEQNQQNKDQQQQDQENKENEDQQKKEKQEQQKKDQQKKDQEQKDKEQQQQEQDEKSKEEQKQDKENQQEQEQKDSKEKDKLPPSVSEKLKQMEMSEEKAKMILEAMKNQEIQYLQQNKRKATKPKDKGKPDW